MNNGIKSVVGDNSRPVLLNKDNEYWPLISTVAGNGYDGLTILPRWATPIYFNCDTAACTLAEWIATAAGTGDFSNLLTFTKAISSRALLSLRQDGFMFHQANMRSGDVGSFTIGKQVGTFSILQIWVETVTQEMTRLTSWPLISIKQDDLAQQFTDRMTRDKCAPSLVYNFDDSSKHITSATLTTSGNCTASIPVTFPAAASADALGTSRKEQLGSDPLTIWADMTGAARTFTLTTPLAL